jgi:hypothetical protein
LLVGDAMSSLSLIEPNLDADLLTVAKVGDRYIEMSLSRLTIGSTFVRT